MLQKTKEIDIKKWALRILRNWYWFVLSCALVSAVGIYYYYSHTAEYSVDAQIMLRTPESNNAFANSELLQMMGMGGTKNTEDEVAMLSSRDIVGKAIQTLDLRTEYRKKAGLRWAGQYPKHDLTIVYPEMFLDTMRIAVRVKIKVKDDECACRYWSLLFNGDFA